jgi:small subunit ribosomal protein S6
MTDYEVTYILRPSLEESEIEERANAIAEIVKGQGGEVTAVERLGKKRLAYEINDSREGNYVVMQFKAGATVSKELDRQLKLHEDVLRALIVKLDAKMQAHMAALAAAAPPPPQSADENVRGPATFVPHR